MKKINSQLEHLIEFIEVLWLSTALDKQSSNVNFSYKVRAENEIELCIYGICGYVSYRNNCYCYQHDFIRRIDMFEDTVDLLNHIEQLAKNENNSSII